MSLKHGNIIIANLLGQQIIPEQSMEDSQIFDEEYYLEHNPDVKDAVIKGTFKTGKDHYIKYGKDEGRKVKFNIITDILRTNPTLLDHIDNYINPLTLKGYVAIPRVPEKKLNMVDVPLRFKPIQSIEYPEGNKIPFERYFEQYFVENRPETLRKYLPIMWTAYYVNYLYGTNEAAIKILQKYIDSLPKNEKYFTLVQYDDHILNNISGLDILVYASGNNKPGSYPIPLLSGPLCCSPFEMPAKDILYSFIGANTHPIREQLVNELNSEYVRFGSLPHNEYINELERSTFVLACRGYGVASFRMYEAMSVGAIPVYVSDSHLEPFNLPLSEYAVKIYPEQIKDIPLILASVDVLGMQDKVKNYFEKYFTYSSCADVIINTLL
jgi:hypothetical protein